MTGLSNAIRAQSHGLSISQLHFFGVSCILSKALMDSSYIVIVMITYSRHLLEYDQPRVLRQLLHLIRGNVAVSSLKIIVT